MALEVEQCLVHVGFTPFQTVHLLYWMNHNGLREPTNLRCVVGLAKHGQTQIKQSWGGRDKQGIDTPSGRNCKTYWVFTGSLRSGVNSILGEGCSLFTI